MNRLFFYLLVGVALSVASCQPKQTVASGTPEPAVERQMTVADPAQYQPLYVHPVLKDQELYAQKTALGAYGQVLPVNQERSEIDLLTRSYWVIELYHDPNAEIEQRRKGTGQWFRFKKDGSFTAGHWDRITHSGAWYIVFSGKDRYLTIDSNVDRQDARWNIQAIAGDESAMAMVRENDFGPKVAVPVQCKLLPLDNMPTKPSLESNKAE
ncbi:MAG: hypothetical protein HC821_00280, partial [Lewinella sp.]|nr:hypothetical protein [Lewinella sp.]